jgi:4a-hydroxytetrahydrobiopterin dehydratase
MFILPFAKPTFIIVLNSLSGPYPRSKPIQMSAVDNNEDPKAQAQKCVPCESLDTSSLLKPEKAEEEVSKLPLWEPDGIPITKICRKFTAKNFQSALDAMNDVGKIAEREGHHPDLHLTSYREVEITLYTHSVSGLTQNDLSLAKMIDDEVKVLYSPKWLKQNAVAKPTAK